MKHSEEVVHMSMSAQKLREMESLCRNKVLPFPDNVLEELKTLKKEVDILNNKYYI